MTFSSFKPLLISRLDLNIDSIIGTNTKKKEKSTLIDKIRKEDLIWVQKPGFDLRINPLMNFAITFDQADTSLRSDTLNFYQNTRGIELSANIGQKITIYTSFLENQVFLPQYQDDFVKKYNVVPGQGRIKPFKKSGYDFAMSEAYISYSASKNLNFKLANGKNFIGNGYRSLLLSDNSFNYPHLMVNSLFFNGNLNYINTYASLQSLERIPFYNTVESPFIKKQGTFHYLSLNLGEFAQIGLFEGILWQRWDSAGSLDFNAQSLIPIIGLNSILLKPKSRTNAVHGINLLLKTTNTTNLYGQIAFDDLSENRLAYQAGFRYFDAFTLDNLHFQFEFNQANAFSYGSENALLNYSHYNQPLAHPFGGGFEEMIAFINYSFNDFYFEYRYSNLSFKNDSNGFYVESDIFNTTNSLISTDLDKASININQFKIGYIVNRRTNLRMELSYMLRSRVGNQKLSDMNSQLLTVSLKTDLFNSYFDF
jgi:hypothetical protein